MTNRVIKPMSECSDVELLWLFAMENSQEAFSNIVTVSGHDLFNGPAPVPKRKLKGMGLAFPPLRMKCLRRFTIRTPFSGSV